MQLPFSVRPKALARKLATATEGSGSSRSFSVQADAARNRGDWKEAATLYAQAVAADPARTGLLVQLGHAEKELGNFDKAETAYRKFHGMHPDNADIFLQLGHLFNRMGELDKASQWYEKGLAIAPNDPELSRHAGMLRGRSRKPGAEQKRRLAMQHVEEREWADARKLLHELVVTEGERDLISVYANVTKEDGDFDQARLLYDDYRAYADDCDPDSVEDVELQLGHLHKLAGDYGKALTHYIQSRQARAARLGYIDQSAQIDREIQACLSEVYTCFEPI